MTTMPDTQPPTTACRTITSRANARVKMIASLHAREGREEAGMFWAEGRRCVEAALAASARVEEVAVCADAFVAMADLLDTARDRGCAVVAYDRACFAKFTAVRHPEGIGAVVRMPAARGLPSTDAATLVLWRLQDPGNQGSSIRSAAAMGVRSIVTVEPCVDAHHPLCVRATAGQIFSVELCSCGEEAARAWLAPQLAKAAVLSADGGFPVEAVRDGVRTLVVGGEARGVPEDLRALMTSLAIPMAPGVESLNVNAATAIALYEWRRAARDTE